MTLIRRFFVLLAFFLALELFTSAWAVIGFNDNKNRFAYVVKLIMPDGSMCSGVALSDYLIMTAAHCVKNPGTSIVNTLDIYIPLDDGQMRKIGARKVFVSQEFIKNHILPNGMSHPTVLSDTAFVVPVVPLSLEEYPRTVFDLVEEYGARKKMRGESFQLSPETMREAIVGAIPYPAKIWTIGYGGNCAEDGHLYGCTNDREKRYGWSDGLRLQLYVSADGPDFREPWMWCVGKNDYANTAPTRPGDSGGPSFATTYDGRQLIVGPNSIAALNRTYSCASSLLGNIDLYREAFAYARELELGGRTTDTAWNAYAERLAKRFAHEIIDAWFSTYQPHGNPEAIRHLSSLYIEPVDFFKKGMTAADAIIDEKRKIFEAWPQRYSQFHDVRANCRIMGRICEIEFDVTWEYQVPGTIVSTNWMAPRNPGFKRVSNSTTFMFTLERRPDAFTDMSRSIVQENTRPMQRR